jgi:hypothetical protein
VTTVKVESLLPNTQYILYATALTYVAANTTAANTTVIPVKKVESEPSETLVSWTDPAFPAFVEVRLVKSSPQKHTFTNLVSVFVPFIKYFLRSSRFHSIYFLTLTSFYY